MDRVLNNGHKRFRAFDSESADAEDRGTAAAGASEEVLGSLAVGRRLRRFWEQTKQEVSAAARESKDVVTGRRDWRHRQKAPPLRLGRQRSVSESSSLAVIYDAACSSEGSDDDDQGQKAAGGRTSGESTKKVRRPGGWRALTDRMLLNAGGGSAAFEALNCEYSYWSLCNHDQQRLQKQPLLERKPHDGSKQASLPMWRRPLSWLDSIRPKRASLH